MRTLHFAGVAVCALTFAGCGGSSTDAGNLPPTQSTHKAAPLLKAAAGEHGECSSGVFNWTPRLSGGGITVVTAASVHQTVGVGLVDGRTITASATPGPVNLLYSIEMPKVPVSKVRRVVLMADDGSICVVPKG